MGKLKRVVAFAALVLLCPPRGQGQSRSGNQNQRGVDTQRSVLRVEVGTAGFLSAFGHRHEIEGRIAQGDLRCGDAPKVDLLIESKNLRVLDPGESDDVRAKIQARMLGSEVLDAGQFPEIRFRSTSVWPAGKDHWTVRGDLTLHGQTHPIAADVTLANGQYRGETRLRQSGFGISPVSVAGGAVKVKDEVKVSFDLATLPGSCDADHR